MIPKTHIYQAPGGPASLCLKTDKPSSSIDGHNQARLSQKQSEHSFWIDSLAKAVHSGDSADKACALSRDDSQLVTVAYHYSSCPECAVTGQPRASLIINY